MHVVTFAGSLRTDSLNKKYAREASRLAAEMGHTGEFVDLKELAIPLYDGDVQEREGFPPGVTQLAQKIAAADAVIIATPEYNGGISGVLKNATDWTSRIKPDPLYGKHVLLLGATPGGLGAVRGLWHSRVPLEAMGAHVYPAMMGLAQAHTHFGGGDRLTEEKEAALKDTLKSFLAHAAKQ